MRRGKQILIALMAAAAMLAAAAAPALLAAGQPGASRLAPLPQTTPDTGSDDGLPPAAVLAAHMWLADHLGLADSSQVRLISAAQAEWPDVCLGLGQPDEVCAQLLTDGWEIVLEADGQLYTLRTDWPGAAVRLADQKTATSSRPLEDTSWQLATLNGSSVISGSTISLAFLADGELSGQGGCNGYGGSYQTGDGALTVTDLVSTLRACADAEVTAQEQAYLAALATANGFGLSGSQLTIAYPDGTLVFNSASGSSAHLPPGWVRQSFGSNWDVAFPGGWDVRPGGGTTELEGAWQDHNYKVTLADASAVHQDTLAGWVEDALAQLSPVHDALAVHNLAVGGAPAMFARSVPLGYEPSPQHRVYVWGSEGRNPRLITFTQVDDQDYDAQAMAGFAMLFLGQVGGSPAVGGETPAASDEHTAAVTGIISYYGDGTQGVVDAPATVQAGAPFTVTVNTFGGGCETAGDTGVSMTADGATVTVFDETTATNDQVVCPAILRRLPHTASLTFDEAGERVITIVGRRVGSETPADGVPFTLEHRVTVQ